MAKIEEELVFAKLAKTAIEGELTEEAIKVLQDAEVRSSISAR
jgi:hypothetical protein